MANKARNGHAQLRRRDLHFLQMRRELYTLQSSVFGLWSSSNCNAFTPFTRRNLCGISHLGVQECQTLVDIFDFMDAHASAVRLAQFLRRYDLQQLQQLDAIGQVCE